jgi:hypothetical protein
MAMMKRILPIFVLLCVAVATWAQRGEKRVTFKQPFSLQEKGIGANPIEGQLVLNAQDEEPVVSRALLETIQGFHLSVLDRAQNAAEPLLPKHEYKTDIAPITDESIRSYNASNSGSLALDPTLEYGWQYILNYEIHVERDRYFFIEMKPKLYFKGAASSTWREYKRDYSGDFFGAMLSDALKGKFKAMAESKRAPH